MRCPQCNLRNSVAAKKCSSCGTPFRKKAMPASIKVALILSLFGLILLGFLTMYLPGVLDPAQQLAGLAKKVAAGGKDEQSNKQIAQDFNKAIVEFLLKEGNSKRLLVKLRQVLPEESFEVHVIDLSTTLKLVEVDTILQAQTFLVLNNKGNQKVFPLADVEVLESAKIINDPAGPVLVLLAHSSGQPPHKPQLKAFALLPDDILDETEKYLPSIAGDGTGTMTNEGKTINLQISLASKAHEEELLDLQTSSLEDKPILYTLVFKDSKYIEQVKTPNNQLMTLYALAQGLRRGSANSEYSNYIGPQGNTLVKQYSQSFKSNQPIKVSGSGREFVLSNKEKQIKVELEKQGNNWIVKNFSTANTLKDIQTTSSLPDNTKDIKQETIKPTDSQQNLLTTLPPPAKVVVKQSAQKQILDQETEQETPKTATGKTNSKEKPASEDSSKKKEEAKDNDKVIGKAWVDNSLSSSTINIRKSPSMSAKSVGSASKGSQLEILAKESGWYKVRQNGQVGYVYGGLIDFKKQDAYTTARIRKSSPIVDGRNKLMAKPQVGDKVVILSGVQNRKYKVRLASGEIGYVDKDAIDVKLDEPQFVP